MCNISHEFENKVDIIIDGGETNVGIESTVVKVIDNIPTILRPGKITPDDIIEVTGICKMSENIFKKAEGKVESPGMKYKHYAPNNKCILVYNDNQNKLINQLLPLRRSLVFLYHCFYKPTICRNPIQFFHYVLYKGRQAF